jgi:tRNA (mo5U34)-methyltransferase
MPSATADSLRAEVEAFTWYHTIELPSGVITPGEYDTRRAIAKIPFPASLAGMRCLDVGTHDGFWAFEMERRGAAEVLAIDLDDPRQMDISEPGIVWSEAILAERNARRGAFDCAHRALRSQVQRRDLSVYSLAKQEVGEFDFAFIGTLLLHLREPIQALTAIRKVLAPGARLLVNDGVSLSMSLLHPRRPVHTLTLFPARPYWWLPNAQGLRRYVEKAGFERVRGGAPYLFPRGPGHPGEEGPPTWRNFASRSWQKRGMPHAWALGEAP